MSIQGICSGYGIKGNYRTTNQTEETNLSNLEDLLSTLEVLKLLQEALDKLDKLGKKLDPNGEVAKIYVEILHKKERTIASPITLLKEVLRLTLERIDAFPANKKAAVKVDRSFIEEIYKAASKAEEKTTAFKASLSKENLKSFDLIFGQFNQNTNKPLDALIEVFDTMATTITLNLNPETKQQLAVTGKKLYPKFEEVDALIKTLCPGFIVDPDPIAPPLVAVVAAPEIHEIQQEEPKPQPNYHFAFRFGLGYLGRIGRHPFGTSALSVFSDSKPGGAFDAGGSFSATLPGGHSLGLDAQFTGSYDFGGDQSLISRNDIGSLWYKYSTDTLNVLVKAGGINPQHNYSTELDPMLTAATQEFFVTRALGEWGIFNFSEAFIGGKAQIQDDKARQNQIAVSGTTSLSFHAGGSEYITLGGKALYNLARGGAGGGALFGFSGTHASNHFAFMFQFTNDTSNKGRFNQASLGLHYNYGEYFGGCASFTWMDYNGNSSNRLDLSAAGNIPLGKGVSLSPSVNLTTGEEDRHIPIGLGGFLSVIYSFNNTPTPPMNPDSYLPFDLSPRNEVQNEASHGR